MQACGLQPWLLDTQYRMHPAIADFPSRMFYKGLIKTGLSAEERPLPPGACIVMALLEHALGLRTRHRHALPMQLRQGVSRAGAQLRFPSSPEEPMQSLQC